MDENTHVIVQRWKELGKMQQSVQQMLKSRFLKFFFTPQPPSGSLCSKNFPKTVRLRYRHCIFFRIVNKWKILMFYNKPWVYVSVRVESNTDSILSHSVSKNAWRPYHIRRSKMTSKAVFRTSKVSKWAICKTSRMFCFATSKDLREKHPIRKEQNNYLIKKLFQICISNKLFEITLKFPI